MTERTQGRKNRLFVAVDLRSIDAKAFEIEYIERGVMAEIFERFGSDWDEMDLRAYPARDREELLGRIRWLSREKKILKWRTPRSRGRLPPESWHKVIHSDALLWCVRSQGAGRSRSVFTLVANDAGYAELLKELEEASVQTLICIWKDAPEGMMGEFEHDRVSKIEPESVNANEW
ncbi:MAG: hypothetical protein OXI16_13995 [Chloroflexota bacterium]|nr:hypothetical protein [Chloroflexota bacterium]